MNFTLKIFKNNNILLFICISISWIKGEAKIKENAQIIEVLKINLNLP